MSFLVCRNDNYEEFMKQISEIKFSKLSIISLALFPLLPFFSVLVFAALLLYEQKTKPNTFYIFFFLLSLYLGLINATKVQDNDLENYYAVFSEVKFYSFFDYILAIGKEPVFFALNYIIYYLTGGNTQWYIIIISILPYNFFFIAIYKFFQKVNNQNSIIVFAIILAAFFPQLFSLSAQLIRQFLAASIIMYVLVSKIFYGKTKWFYLLSAVFIHSTVLFFIPFIFINYFKKRFNLKTIIPVIVLFFLFLISFQKIAEYIISKFGVSFLTYAITKAGNTTLFELQPLPALAFILLGVMFIISAYRIYGKPILNDENLKRILTHFVNIFIILSLFILATINQKELSVRFFFYVYFFFPFIIPLMFKKENKLSSLFQGAILMLFIAFFIYRLEYGTWQYAPLPELLLNPFF